MLPPSPTYAPPPPRPCDGCAIIVLAAGRGTRMGVPKALMPVNGQPWWTHQHHRLSQLGGVVKWVVSDDVAAGIERVCDLAFVIDRVVVDSAAPMFHSVLAGIEQWTGRPARSSTLPVRPGGTPGPPVLPQTMGTHAGVFILPIDVPAPKPETWHSIRLDASIPHPLIPSPNSSPRVPTHQGKRGHPVFLPASWIAFTLFPLLPNLSSWNPANPDADTRASLDPFRLDYLIEPDRILVPVDDPGILANLNTPADVQAWLRTSASDGVR